MWVRSLGQEAPLEEGMATHSSILAWKNPTDKGAWQAMVHRVTKSQPRLKQLSTHTFSSKLLSSPGCHTTLSSIPCAIQYVLNGYPFYTCSVVPSLYT